MSPLHSLAYSVLCREAGIESMPRSAAPAASALDSRAEILHPVRPLRRLPFVRETWCACGPSSAAPAVGRTRRSNGFCFRVARAVIVCTPCGLRYRESVVCRAAFQCSARPLPRLLPSICGRRFCIQFGRSCGLTMAVRRWSHDAWLPRVLRGSAVPMHPVRPLPRLRPWIRKGAQEGGAQWAGGREGRKGCMESDHGGVSLGPAVGVADVFPSVA